MKRTIVYIVSDVRSGSTLLENVLSKSSQVVSLGELHHLDSHLHKGKWGRTWNWSCSCGTSFDKCDFWQRVFTEMGISDVNEIDKTTLSPLMNGLSPKGKEQQMRTLKLLNRIYEAVFNVARTNVIIDSSKTPNQGALLFKNSPYEFKIIHLKRDIRAVTISKIKWNTQFFGKSLNPKKVLFSSFRYRLRCNRLLNNLDKSNVLSLKYEDFISNPQKELNLIAEFIGLEPFTMPEFMELNDDHTIGGTPNRFEKRKIKFDDNWIKAVNEKPLMKFIGAVLNKLA